MANFTGVTFAGNNLQSFASGHGIFVSDIQHAGKGAKRAQIYALSHGNASAIPFVEYPYKPITVSGKIVGTSITDCDAQIDTFNSYLLTQNGNLDIDYNSGTRRYIATATNIDVNRPGGLTWASFDVTFTCTQPFGQDTSTTGLLSASGRTSASYADSITLAGTAPFQLPVITITYSAIGGAPVSGAVNIGNDTTGQQIYVSRTWAATDVLVIDCTLNTVTVNGAAVNFSGAFPVFVVGAGTLDYSDTFASRTFAVSAVYTKAYL